jgi:tetratricopeptide (TPR) repeat protein
MQSPPLRRGATAQSAEAFTFEGRLDNEESTLDAILASMGRGTLPAGTWERLFAASQRDGRLSELAFAFESASQGKRLKALAPALAAEFLFQAACFFGDAFGDELGAVPYLERALAALPAHWGSFAKVEQILRKTQQPKKLAEVYAKVAQHRPRGEQPALLRRAAELLIETGGPEDKVIELLQHILRLEPGDEQTRAQLEALCIKGNRLRDVVRLNEQALAAEPPPDDATRAKLLSRIVEVYADRLHEPERAMPHVEQLLALDPSSEQGRRVAQKLVVVKGLAGRAASALANSYEASGPAAEVARYVTIELENTRGPKRASLLARLGKLRAERMGEDAGAFEAFEQALAIDADADDLRGAYFALTRKLGRFANAAKTLGRVLATVKSPTVKARVGAQLGESLLRSGDARRAKATLAGVLAAPEAPIDALLAASTALAEIHAAENDKRALADVLERIVALELDPDKRQSADERLAALAMEAGNVDRAIAAYERLLSTSARPRALAALAPLYQVSGDPEKHARLLEEQAKDTQDPALARDRMMRAAEARAGATGDPATAIASCRALIDRFGPARDVLALLIPLLEAQRKWPELGHALAEEAALTSGPDCAQVMSRLGALRMQRLADSPGAIEAFRESLSLDPADKTARMMLERLTVIGDHRLAAARVLEPVYRAQGASGALLKMLELRGTLEPDVDQRLASLREAEQLAEGGEVGRAAEIIGRALADAVAYNRALGEWLDRLDAVAAPGTEAKRRAAILGNALGDREVTSDDLSGLTKRAAEAYASAGEAETAISLYRRALAFEPHSADLLSRVDDLLRDQGSPKERIALYRAALAPAGTSRRRELLHRVGAIERHDLGDTTAAIQTYRTALDDDAGDTDAETALAELYAQTEQWNELCALLETRLLRVEGDAARATRATLAAVASAHGDDARARAQCTRLLEEPELSPEHLDAVALAAVALDDAKLERAVLQRRVEMTHDPREQIVWLDRLAELDEQRIGDLEAAASAWKRGAGLAEAAGEDELARRLYARARRVAPEDREVTARLVVLSERAQVWENLPLLYVSLGEQSADEGERVDLWLRAARVLSERLGDAAGAADRARIVFELTPLRADVLSAFEELSVAAGAIDAFEVAVVDALVRLEAAGGFDGEPRARLLLARARALAGDARRLNDAATAYRTILDDPNVDRGQLAGALTAFETLLARDTDSTRLRADRRWLLEWRAEHASEEERPARLLDWAREEETTFADPAQALALHRRVLGLDPDSDEALAAMTRLALATGDTDAALTALAARRDRADGAARTGIELEIAQVLLGRTTRWHEALAALRAVLADSPNDPTARTLAGRLLEQESTRGDAIRMLEQACEATEDVAARAEILTRLLDAPIEGISDARRRWFERLSDLQREQDGPETAMATAVRAAREMLSVPALWDRAEALARTLSRPEAMAALYEEVLARPLTNDQARTIGERAVQFYEEWFEDSGRVVRILERVLELDATADWAFDRLKLLLDAAERWDDLFALYDRTLALASERTRLSLLEDAAQTAKDFASRPDRAIDYLEQLNKLRPGDAKVTSALERLYERQGRHRELVGLLTTRLPTLARDETLRTRTRIAVLWLDGLKEPAAAFEAIEPVLRRGDAPANGATPEVWPLLERILAAAPPDPEPPRTSAPPPRASERPRSKRARKSEPPASSPTSVRQRVAASLREHYAHAGQDADLVRMLLVELEAVTTAKERVRRHLQIADSYEKLGELGSALEQVGFAVALDPHDEAKRVKLAQLAEGANRLERFTELLTAAAEASDDPSLSIALTMQAATVRADRVGDAAGAIALLSSVLTTPKLGDDDLLAAGRKLEPLLEAAGRDEERLDVLAQIATVEPDAGARREALGRAAALAAKLGQDQRAVAFWEKRVAADEKDVEALDGLVGLLENRSPSQRLAEILELRARSSANDAQRRADRVRVAELFGAALDRPKEAIDVWRDIEREFGEADDAAAALAGLLRTTQRWGDLANLLERGAVRASDNATRSDLFRQLGDVHRERLDAAAAAIETYARSLSADPTNSGARAGLLALANEAGLRASAVAVLLGALRLSDDWRGIRDLTEQRLLAADSDLDRLAILREAAEISERRAVDPNGGFEAMRRAFVIAPADEGIEREATRLAGAAGAWDRLVSAYREAIERTAHADSVLVARLRASAGATLETRLGDARGALAEYLQVVRDTWDVAVGCDALRVAGGLAEWDIAARVVVDVAMAGGAASPTLLDAYGQAAEASGGWDRATLSLASAASSAGLSGAAARDVQSRVAVWHRDRRGDPDAAQAALEQALVHDGSDANLLLMLVELQRRHPGRPLVENLLRLSRATDGSAALLCEAAEVASESAGDLPLARSILTDLLALARERWQGGGSAEASGHAQWAIERLAKLHERDGDTSAVVAVLMQGDALPFERDVRRGMRRRAARIALDRLGDDERALALYLALFDEDPHDEEAVQRLAAIYGAHGRTRELLSLRERQVAAANDLAERIRLRMEAAQLLVALGERARAADVLAASLAEDPRHQGTVEALADVLDAAERTTDLRELLVDQAQRAEHAGDPRRAAELWWRSAVLAEQRLGEVAVAEAYHERVAALEERPASLDALGRLATARGDHGAAAKWLERLLNVIDADRRVEATLRLADALVGAGQPSRATERLAQSLLDAPQAEPLRDRLAARYREEGDSERLAKVIADAAIYAADKQTRMARLREAARLFSDACARPDLAVPLLEQATDLAPEDQSAALALADALARSERYDDARSMLKSMVDAFGGRRPKERAPVHYQMARLELAMGNRARALVELDTAARVDPQNPDILRALAELARDDGQLERAEKSYRALLVVLRRREESVGSAGVARSEVLLELSAIAERQGETERSREVLESALEAAAKGDFEQQRLEGALRARGDHETLVRVLEAKVERAGDSPQAAATLAELAELLSERIGRPDQALSVRLRGVGLDPRSDAAHEAALALARSMDNVRRYVDATTGLVERAIERGDVPLACSLLVRLAAVAEHDLHDDAHAASLLERAVDLGLRTAEALRSLDRALDRLGDTQKQARVLSMRIEVEGREGGPRAASDAVYRLAALRLASKDTLDEGVRMMRAALELDPQLDRAEDALRRAVALDPSHAPLLDLYEYVGRQPGYERVLVDVLKARSELPGADLSTVREAVDAALRIGDSAQAESLLGRVIERQPSSGDSAASVAWALDTLSNLRRAAGDLPKALELKRTAARMADPDVARRLTFEVARIAAEELGDWPLAAHAYEGLLAAEPGDREAWEPLLGVYRHEGQTSKLAALLAAVVDHVEDRSLRARLRLERVRVMQELGLTDAEAASFLREIVDEDASQVQAALMLAAIHERAGARDELTDLLARQIDSAKDRNDAASIVSLSMRLGAILEGTDRGQARDVYYKGLEWEPKSRELLDGLIALLDQEGDAGERADLLERRIALEQGPAAEELALELWAARMQLGDETGADRALEIGYRAQPASSALRDRLESVFRRRSEWRKLAELCILDASVRSDAGERVTRLREAAAILRTQLRDARGAAAALGLARQAVETGRADSIDLDLLRDHVDMLFESGDFSATLLELSRVIDLLAVDDPNRPALFAARANVRSASGDESGALGDFEAAFTIDPGAYARSLALQLETAYISASSAGDASAARLLRLRLAQVLPSTGDVDEARAILADLLKQDPKDLAALRTLATLEWGLERWEAAGATLKRLVGLEEPEATVETALRLADACERAKRPGDARGALERARSAAPHDRGVRQRLERLYDQMGAFHELAEMVLEDARGSGDVADRFQRLLRAGALLLERAGDPAASIDPLAEARALRPLDPECAALLADAYTLSGRAQDAVAVLEPVIAPHKGRRAKELAPLHWRLARVARYFGNTADEVRSLGQAFDCDAQNGQVCADVALRAMEVDQLELASRALRAITLLRTPGPMSKALAYQYMGEIARRQGDPKRAMMLLHRALTEDPSLETARVLVDAITQEANS